MWRSVKHVLVLTDVMGVLDPANITVGQVAQWLVLVLSGTGVFGAVLFGFRNGWGKKAAAEQKKILELSQQAANEWESIANARKDRIDSLIDELVKVTRLNEQLGIANRNLLDRLEAKAK